MAQRKKNVLITGTSSGFGRVTALQLSKTMHVIATMRDLSRAESLEKEIKKQGGSIDIHYCDVTKQMSIDTLVETIKATYNRLDVLINNAGYGIGGYFEDLSDDEIRDQFETNFFGLQRVTRGFLPMFRTQNKGTIINLSSIAGLTGTPCIGAYNASKWAVEGFSESLLFELAPFNIDVVLVEPGQFKTDIFKRNLKLAKNMTDESSPYYQFSSALMPIFNKMVQNNNQDPIKVAKLIELIINKKKPNFRYLIGKDAFIRLWVRRLLPFNWYRSLVTQKYLHLISNKSAS